MATNTQRIAIVGVDESDQIGRVENKSSLQHHAEAAFNLSLIHISEPTRPY